jgi:hypothetical protein
MTKCPLHEEKSSRESLEVPSAWMSNWFHKKNTKQKHPTNQYKYSPANARPRMPMQSPVKATPPRFPSDYETRTRQNSNESSINSCRRAQSTPRARTLLPLHHPKTMLPTQVVEHGSGQEANRTHMGCSIGVERDYSGRFAHSQTAGRCSGRLWPERGQRGVDMGCRVWAIGCVWMHCPLQTWSHQRGSVGGLGNAGVREEGTAWGGQPSSAHFPLWVVEG